MKKTTLLISIVLLAVFTSGVAMAAPDLTDTGAIATGFSNFKAQISTLTNGAIAPGSAAFSDAMMLWSFFAVFLVIWTMYNYIFNKGTLLDLLTVAILIMVDKVLLNQFSLLTSAIYNAGGGFASDIQMALLGTGDLFFAPKFITKLVTSITYDTSTFTGLGEIFTSAISVVVLGLVSMILSALAYFAAIWGFWGYTIAKLIGLIFVPFLMYERLSWLFDGWLRFFFGFVFYAVVARLNLALIAASLAVYFNLPIGNLAAIPATVIPSFTDLSQALGLLVFVLVGIVATLSTGSFVATIVGGSASSSGVGRQVTRGASALAGRFLGGK